jgi:hypothetical protein
MQHDDPTRCPICHQSAARAPLPDGPYAYKVECGACGKFKVLASLPQMVWAGLEEGQKQLLTTGLPAYIRWENRRKMVPLIRDNWDAYAQFGLSPSCLRREERQGAR